MININNAKEYCTDYTKIENYEQAINDNTQTWFCHHKNGITLNCDGKKLKELGLYYDRPPEELIFLTSSEHASLHKSGKTPWNKGIPHSEETRNKQSEAHKGKTHSEETRKKQSEAKSDSNNPMAKECIINGKTYRCIKDAWKDICPEMSLSNFYYRLNNNYYN